MSYTVLHNLISTNEAQLMYFSANVSYASLPVFLPTIIEDMGYNGIDAQGLSAPPNFAAFFAAIIVAWLADKTQQRGLALTMSGIVAGIGYLVLATVNTVGARYFATFLAAAGVFSTIPNILAWTMSMSRHYHCSSLLIQRQITKEVTPAVVLD